MTTTAHVPSGMTVLRSPDRERISILIWALALANLALHFYFNNRYGYFRDEFDYLACARHLGWGYVDQPPLVPFLARISGELLGYSLRAIRFVPALASSILIVQTAAITHEFGGKRFAIVASAICVLVAPQYLSNGSLLGTNCLEPNLWMACAYFAILAIKRDQPKYWLWCGVFAGLGLEEKYSIGLFIAGIVIGLLLTDQRRVFLNKWIWLGGAAATLIFLPNVLWNFHYHWPFIQLMHNIRAEHRDVVLGAGQYLLQQLLLVNPFTAPFWIRGLIAFLFLRAFKPYRFLGWSYLVCYGVFFVLHGKNYYLAPVYPMLMAAGAVVADANFTRLRASWLRPVAVVLLLTSGFLLLPITVPVLSPDRFLAYTHKLPFKLPVMEYSHARAALPQWYADQFGWREIVEETAVAWNQLSPAERNDCGIFGQDYGQAGAIDFFGPKYGLPPSLSGHQTWFIWGPGHCSGNCMIVLGDSRSNLEALWTNVQYVGTSADNPYALEKQISVYICRGKKFESWQGFWPHVRHWR